MEMDDMDNQILSAPLKPILKTRNELLVEKPCPSWRIEISNGGGGGFQVWHVLDEENFCYERI